jgi:hypothetical protein
VNRRAREADFPNKFAELMERLEAVDGPISAAPYQGAAVGEPHEHATRVYFLDELIELLGWTLGLGGDVVEEARLKDKTTTRMDYLGKACDSDVPALLIEAKAWERPFLQPRLKVEAYRVEKVLADAIDHWRGGGRTALSPLAGEWPDYIDQLGNYVKRLNAIHKHRLPRAVISSGQWIVVFIDPVAAFVEGPAQITSIRFFEKGSYKDDASQLYDLISKDSLIAETPASVRPTEILKFLTSNTLDKCFHAVLVSYETAGSTVFGRKPRISIHPALVLQDLAGMQLTVLEESDGQYMDYGSDEDGADPSLDAHVATVSEAAVALLRKTSEQLGVELRPSSTVDFLGFPRQPLQGPEVLKSLVKNLPRHNDNWIVVTGQDTHFARAGPDLACDFHNWGACNAGHRAQGSMAIIRPTMTPRSLFVDDMPHHCAHRDVLYRRESRCQIPMIDERLCCRSCTFGSVCWPGTVDPPLPCGRPA